MCSLDTTWINLNFQQIKTKAGHFKWPQSALAYSAMLNTITNHNTTMIGTKVFKPPAADVRLHTYDWPSITKGKLSISPRPTLGGVADLFVTNFIIAACSSNHKDFNLKRSFAYYKYTITQQSESLSISAWYQWSFTFDHGTPISYNDLLLVFTIGV